MEQNLVVRGVAFEDEITKVTVLGLANSINKFYQLFLQH